MRALPITVAAIIVTVCLTPLPAFSWGDEGHRIVAQIADHFLTPSATRKAQDRLTTDSDHSLVAASTWADRIKAERPDTKPWHFIDVPLEAPRLSLNRDCAADQCLVAELTRLLAVLKDESAEANARTEALKFVVHFMGDLHQPLHCANHNDRGGNDVKVKYYGLPDNLHHAWDTDIIEHASSDWPDHADRLAAEITAGQLGAWSQGAIEDWANESHALARTRVYPRLPHTRPPNIGDAYQGVAAPRSTAS